MLKFSVNKSLARLSLARTLGAIVFNIIGKAEDQAWTYELLQGARAENPENPELQAFCRNLWPRARAPTCRPAAQRHPPTPSGA